MSTATMTAPPAPSPFAGKPTVGGGEYELCPDGNHAAYLIAIYDLGTHDEDYKGEPKPDVRKLFLAWEIPKQKKKDGTPFVLGKDFSVIVKDDGSWEYGDKSNLRLMLESWRGRKYNADELIDPMACLGKPCLVNVTHSPPKDGKVYANLGAVTRLPEDMTAMPRVNDLVAYHITQGTPPVIKHLPRVYDRPSGKMEPVDVIATASKEKTGQVIGKRSKPADTAYSEAVRPQGPAVPSASSPDDEPPF